MAAPRVKALTSSDGIMSSKTGQHAAALRHVLMLSA